MYMMKRRYMGLNFSKTNHKDNVGQTEGCWNMVFKICMPANLKEEIRSDECKAMASVQEVLDVIFVFRTKLISTIQKKTQKTKDKKLPKKKKRQCPMPF